MWYNSPDLCFREVEDLTEDIFEKIVKRLNSPEESERKEAVLELLRLKDRRAVDLLSRLVEADPAVDVRYHARKAYYLLRDVLPKDRDNPFLELPDGINLDDLERLLLDENSRIRVEAIKLAGKVDPGSIAPLLRSALAQEKLPQLQGALLTAMGRVGARHDIPAVAQFLTMNEPRLQVQAIETLVKIGGIEALEYIVPYIQAPDKEVRESAAKALQPLSSGDLLKILRKMAMSSQVAYRDSAILTLQRYKVPIAAKILAHLATVDPVLALREKARAGLESMAKGDEAARKVLEELVAHEQEEKMDAPSSASPGTTGESPVPGAVAVPVEMVVPGVPPKLVKEISKGDQAQRENGLRQLAPLLKPEHATFLLHRLDHEEDPRIASHLLSLIGKTKAPQAYATVIKHFKHPDDRVRANAIEAAQQIDPVTTPNRVIGFLNDHTNQVRANTIVVCATRPDFDPLVWVRTLAEFGDSAFRRSALFVINRLKRPTFLSVLELLLDDCEMEVRQLAILALQEYASRESPGAKELVAASGKKIAKEQGAAGKFDQDFHSAMNALRAPPPPKKEIHKDEKSAGREMGEQLLGEAGLKKAGQTMKKIQAQAKIAREKVTDGFSKTKATIATVNWAEKLPWLAKIVVLAVILVLHAHGAVKYFQIDIPIRLFHLGSAITAAFLALLLWRYRPGIAGILALLLLMVPLGAVRYGFEDPLAVSSPDANLVNGGSKTPHTPETGTGTRAISPGTTPGTKTASAAIKAEGPDPTISLLSPTRGAVIKGEFAIKAKLTGKPKAVEFFLDNKCLRTFNEKREGTFEHSGVHSDDYPSGSHVVNVRVTDIYDRQVEDMVLVKFPAPLPEIKITSPAGEGGFWRDDRFAATVNGTNHGDVEFLLDNNVLHTFPADPSMRYEQPVPIANLTEGKHIFQVRVSMADERQATASVSFRKLIPQPTVRVVSPKELEEVFGNINISIEADSGWRETAIRNVTWFADGQLRQTFATPPWQGFWDLTDEELGPHELRARVESEIGSIAETVVHINAIKPQFSVAIKGIKPGQVLQEDASGTVDIVNEFSGTTIKKVVMSIDDTPFHEEVQAPFSFSINVNAVPPGSRKLIAEAFRSDGKTFKASMPFSVKPRGRIGMFFSVQDAKGNSLFAKNLEGVRLELKEDGKGVGSLTLQAADSVPTYFGILLDVSAGMKTDQKLTKAKEGASAFLDGMQPYDHGLLLKFSDVPEVVIDFTGDRTKLQQEIEYLSPQRGTALIDAVYMGVERSVKNPDRTVLIVLANSGDENALHTGPASSHTIQEAVEYAERANVQIYGIGLGNSLKTTISDGEAELKTLTQKTGGRYFFVNTASELPHIYRIIMREIRSQTKASFLSPSGDTDGKRHALELSAPDRKDLQFKYKPVFQAK